MRTTWERAVWVGLLAVLSAACGGGGNGEDGQPVTKYYAYLANRASGNISGYSIDPATGSWTAVPGSPFMAGSSPVDMAVAPTGKFAYAVNRGSQNISTYAINAATGALSEISGSPFPTADQPWRASVDNTGRYLFVGLSLRQVSAYTINANTGSLAEISGSPYSQGPLGLNSDLIVDPHGYFLLYVANTGLGIYGYTIDFDTGALSLVQGSPFWNLFFPETSACLATDPQSKFLYVAYDGQFSFVYLDFYRVEWATGNLTLAGVWAGGGAPGEVTPSSLVVDPSGRFLYLTDSRNDKVFAYAINAASGFLSELAGSPFSTGLSPASMAIEPTGKFAYVANFGSNTVSAYSINSTTGVLTPISGSPFPVTGGQGPCAISIIKITQ